MGKFWHQHRRLAILTYTALALLILVSVVPYLIPPGETEAVVSLDDLIGEHGRFLDIRGLRIYIEEQNPASTQATIVFIHGFGGSTFSWRHNVPFFADQGYRVVSLDLKGFGLSQKDFASDYSHLAQAELLAEVLARLEVSQACFVGHSMGTSVMLHFVNLCPEKVLGLISVGGAVNVDGGALGVSALLNFGPFRRIGKVFLTRYVTRERVGTLLESASHQDIVTTEVIDGYYDRLIIGQWAESLLAMTRDMHKNAITFPLEDIAVPTLTFWGEQDTWVTRRSIEKWVDEIPSTEFHAIPETGHLLMEENPQLFNDMVLGFLESHTE